MNVPHALHRVFLPMKVPFFVATTLLWTSVAAYAATKCLFCDGTGFRGNFECSACHGTGKFGK